MGNYFSWNKYNISEVPKATCKTDGVCKYIFFFLQMFHEHVCIHSMCVNIQPWENSWFFGGDFISRSLVLIVGGNTMVSHKRHRSCWVQWQVRHFPVILHIKIQCGVSSNSASGINVVHVVTFIDHIYSWGNRWILIGWYSNAFENLCVQ